MSKKKNPPYSISLINKLVKDLKELPDFKITDEEWGLGECRSFYVRWSWDSISQSYTVEFAIKQYFDRWANSTNFSVDITFTGNYRNNLKECHLWAEKVVKSGLFEWNSYMSTIDMPFFGRPNI